MSVSSEIMEFMKQTLLPEITEIKTELTEFKLEMREELAEIKAEIKVINGRLDLMDQRFDDVGKRFDGMSQRFDGLGQRFDQAQVQMTDTKNEVREIRSYVWSGGRETGHMVHEAPSEYKTDDRES